MRLPLQPASRNHLTPFTEGPRAWLVLARNAIPVIGIYGLGLILGLALALSYIEIYPMRALKFFGGDSTLEAGNEERSRD